MDARDAVNDAALRFHVEDLAADVGRMRNRLRDDEYGLLVVDRIASRVETLSQMVWPTAAEIVRANLEHCDESDAVELALADVDRRARQLRTLLGLREADEWRPARAA